MAMTVSQFSNFDDLSADAADSFVEINKALARLSTRRQTEFAVTGRRARSKIAWKMETFCEAILYRFVELTEGAALCWNAERILGALLCTRAIVETAAVLFDYENRIEALLRESDLGGIDAITMNRAFGSRDPEWIKQSPDLQAVNVLTLIDKMDARLLPGARSHYDRLSERCHPNSFGQHQMFTRTNYQTGTVTFANRRPHQDAPAIIAGLTLLLLAENVFDRLSVLMGQVADVHHERHPRGSV